MSLPNERVYDPSIPIHLRRQFSPILAGFPWQWIGIVEEPRSLADFVDAMPEHRTFITSLHRYESHLFGFRGSQSPSGLLTCLGVEVAYPSSLSEKTKIRAKLPGQLSVNEYLDICSLVCAYRLFEIIALRANCIPRVPSSFPVSELHLPRSKVKSEKNSLHGFEKLEDWSTLLYSFKSVVEKHDAKAKGFHLPPSGHPCHALLQMLGDNETRGSYNAIENNFVRAAIHVAAMETIVFPEHLPPDLPSNLQMLGSGSNFNSEAQHALGIDFSAPMAYQTEFHDESSTGGKSQLTKALRNPLLLSSLITPLYLAVQMLLVKKSFNRRSVLDLAAKLGPHKPPLLIKIEGLFIDVLMRLSKGRTLPDRVLTDLVASIPWDEVETLSNSGERLWFSLEQRVPFPISSAPCQAAALDIPVVPDLFSSMSVDPAPMPSLPPSLAMSFVVSPPIDQSASINTRSWDSCSPSVPEAEDASGTSSVTDADSNVAGSLAASLNSAFQANNSSGVDEDENTHSGTDVTDRAAHPVLASFESTSQSSCITPPPNMIPTDDMDLREADTQLAPDSERSSPGIESLDLSGGGNVMDIDLTSLSSLSTMGNKSELEHAHTDEEMLDMDDAVELSDLTDIDEVDNDSTSPGLPADCSKKAKSSASATSKRGTRPKSSKARDSVTKSKQGSSTTKSKQGKASTTANQDLTAKAKQGGSSTNSNQDGVRKPKPSKVVDVKEPFKDLHVGENVDNPIDVDMFSSLFDPVLPQDYAIKEEISLPEEAPPPRVGSHYVYKAYDAAGNAVQFKPEFHFDIYHTVFRHFMARVKDHYIHGRPRHIYAPLVSCIRIMSFEIFKTLPSNTLSSVLAVKHIVVTGCPIDDRFTFDEYGLRLLAPLNSRVSINDFAIKPKAQTCRPTVVCGQVEDLLLNMGPTGRILNALDFPLSEPSRNTSSFSVDLAAWFAVRGLYTTMLGTSYPTEDMNWATAGHQNTLTLLHIDCDGLNTEDGPACGRKVWGLLSPRSDLPLSSTKFFLDGGFALDDVLESSRYDFEAIVLRPGDRLYMKPGTPHFVFGLDDAICIGGHYYATCLMQDTLQALIHAFVLNDFLTNTSHQPSRLLLRRILFFYHAGLIDGAVSFRDPAHVHLPDIQTIDGILNLLSVVILVFLGNVLDFRTYSAPNQYFKHAATREQTYLMTTYDVNSISHNERQAMSYARGIALFFIRWIRAACIIKGPAGEIVDDLPSSYMVQILAALLAYKKSAQQRKLKGAPHCSLALLAAQVENVVRCDAMLHNVWNSKPMKAPLSLALANKDKYSVSWKEGQEASWRSQNLDFFALGLTPFDRLYFQYQNGRGENEAAKVASEIESEMAVGKKRKLL